MMAKRIAFYSTSCFLFGCRVSFTTLTPILSQSFSPLASNSQAFYSHPPLLKERGYKKRSYFSIFGLMLELNMLLLDKSSKW